jgi:phosphatidylserine/phosphatidylglycerophosphate/cardiolipin synthase-like enzyme
MDRFIEVVRERRGQDPDFMALVLFDFSSVLFAGDLFGRTQKELQEAGVEVRGFNPPSWGVAPLYDARLHDKVLVVDGRQMILGGRNLCDHYLDPSNSWLDCDVLVDGPAAQEAQMHFLKAWETATRMQRLGRFIKPQESVRADLRSLWETGRYRNGRSPLTRYMNTGFFPPLDGTGPQRVAVLYDNSLVWERAPTMDLLPALVDRADTVVNLMTPFPNLTEELTTSLLAAAERRVTVRVVINDEKAMVRDGTFWLALLPTLIRLIEGGVEVWAWQGNGPVLEEADRLGRTPARLPGQCIHAKLALIDDRVAIVHSSNFNYRSAYYNTEAGVLVLDDAAFSNRMARHFEFVIESGPRTFSCTGDAGDSVVEANLMRRLSAEDVPELRSQLGSRQKFLESMSVLW